MVTRTMAAASGLLRSVQGVPTTCDPQVAALLEGAFMRFDQWKYSREENMRSKLMRLRCSLDHLLTRLLGARDFAGAAQVLSVLYHRFTLIPARCVQASLEILRRHPQQHKDELMQFYQTALQNARLDPVMIYKEMLMLHIVSGDYYEGYHLFKQEMQELDIHHDAHLQGMFGMVCYWLLFIESEEIRMRYSRSPPDEGDGDDDEDNNDDGSNTQGPPRTLRRNRRAPAFEMSSANELVESRYRFKTSIGIHILYQEAVGALRRAIAVSPESPVFVEFYVQLLTMAGDVERACDVLEHFYHSNPADPHAARLLARFLQAHFPHSASAQVEIYASWLHNDPASAEALEKLMELSHTAIVAAAQLLPVLATAVDAFGSDHHLAQSPKPVTALWIAFGETLQSCLDDQSSKTAAAVESVRSSRPWWMTSYFSRPKCAADARAFVANNEIHGELLVRKAVISYQLFGEQAITIARAVHCLGQEDVGIFKPSVLKYFRRVFHHELANALFSSTKEETQGDSNSDLHVIPRLPSVSVLSRSVLVKDTKHATRPTIQVTRLDDDAAVVDQELVRALEEAVRVELGDEPKTQHGGRKRSFDSMITGLLTANSENTLAVPLYVDLLEEWLYKRSVTWYPHLQVQLKAHLQEAGGFIPSWLEVAEASRYFQQRWVANECHHDHPGLLLRYEAFLVRYMRTRAKASEYWALGVSSETVHDALREMKLHVSRSHVHFPEFEEAAKWMRIKASYFMRTRRRLLRDYMMAMRFVVFHTQQHIETKDLVDAAMQVAVQNHHSDLLAPEALARQAQIILVSRYAFTVRNLRHTYRAFLESYVRGGRVCKAVDMLAALKRRWRRVSSATLVEVQAFLWLKAWEVDNPGRLHTLMDDRYLTMA